MDGTKLLFPQVHVLFVEYILIFPDQAFLIAMTWSCPCKQSHGFCSFSGDDSNCPQETQKLFLHVATECGET